MNPLATPLRRGVIVAALLAAVASPAAATMPPREGPVPAVLSSGFTDGLFAVPAPSPLGTQSGAATQTNWVIPIILVDFQDQPLQASSTHAFWEFQLFDTTGAHPSGSVWDYYHWVSGNRIHVTGRVVATIHLSQNKNFYANSSWGLNRLSTPNNTYGAVDEALRFSDAAVDWTPFDQDHDGYVDMVWVVHSGLGGENVVTGQDLWSITSVLSEWARGGVFETNDLVPGTLLKMRINRFAVMPEMSAVRPGQPCEIGVFCHEFGHALGLPDLYDTTSGSRNVGPGNWSLMSTGAYGTDGASPEYPAHPGAWPSLFMGWARSTRAVTDTLVLLPPLVTAGAVLDLWFQGEAGPEHFLIENRQRFGFDRNLPQEGLIVYHVDDLLIGQRLSGNRINVGSPMGLRLVEADGNGDLVSGRSRGDEWDPFPGRGNRTLVTDDTSPSLRSNSGAMTHVALVDIGPFADFMRFVARVRAHGWQPPVELPSPSFTAGSIGGPGPRAVRLPDNGAAIVTSESNGGPARIVVRRRTGTGAWSGPEVVSESPGTAIEPTVGVLPGGDLAVAWADTRHGAYEIYFRASAGGVWMPERRITDRTGSSRAPSLGVDDHGGVHLAWQLTENARVQILFVHFPASAPIGDAVAVSPVTSLPDPPLVATGPERRSYVLWTDRVSSPSLIWFARFQADSGVVSARQRLAPNSGYSQGAVGAAIDPVGTLHSAWVANGPGGTQELHYQRRQLGGAAPLIRDTTIERSGDGILNPTLAVDPTGGVHIAFERSLAGIPQIRYRQWDALSGWDMSSTEVTPAAEGFAGFPSLVPIHPRIVNLLYAAIRSGEVAWIERSRSALASGAPTAVAGPPPARLPVAAVPNPLRPGHALRLRGAGAPPAGLRLAVYDLGGRRVADAVPVPDESGWSAAIDGRVTTRWPAGVYFARLGDRHAATRIVVLR